MTISFAPISTNPDARNPHHSPGKDLSRRFKISTCGRRRTQYYTRVIRQYVRDFALAALAAIDDPDEWQRRQFYAYFRRNNQRARETVRRRYLKIAEEARHTPEHAKVHVLCYDVQGECSHLDELHGGRPLAYVDDTESFIVLVCCLSQTGHVCCPAFHYLPSFFSQRRDENVASTMLHELTHVRAMNLGAVTEDYLPNKEVPAGHMFDHLSPAQALNNAYSYEWFARDMWEVYGAPTSSEESEGFEE
ncbi:MAG: hypothetical protein Q9160_006944 [Pyrenula sp. 1 TL-2023]